MAYQGGPAPGNAQNGYWSGQGPPSNAYGMQERSSQPLPNQSLPRYQPPSNSAQYSNQNVQMQYGMRNDYANSAGSYPPAPVQAPPQQQHFQQPQFISPSQIFQQSSTPPRYSQQYSNSPQASNGQGAPYISPNKLSRMGSGLSSQPDMSVLLISLAEEYFEAAHNLTAGSIEQYQELIAHGLGCLDTMLKRVKMAPRTEAKVQLRYAGVLFEETDNMMEAETALSKGISLCERNHYYDLKYAMQFLLAKFMGKKNPKASIKTLDSHISDAEAFQHFPWVYAFRFLRITYAVETGNITDSHAAIQNLRALARVAEHQDDRPIQMTASLMMAMAWLRSSSPDAMEQAQRALAQIWSFQFDPSCQIPQLTALAHILDVSCCIKQGNAAHTQSKLKALQNAMDSTLKDLSWDDNDDAVSIPIRRTPKSSQVVSRETRSIISIGADGGDKLMISCLTRKDAFAIAYIVTGLAVFHVNRPKGLDCLRLAMDMLTSSDSGIRSTNLPSGLIPLFFKRRQWLGQMICYVHIYMAFFYTPGGDWAKVNRHLGLFNESVEKYKTHLDETLVLLRLYLEGMYYQGTGNIDQALNSYEDERLLLPSTPTSAATSQGRIRQDIAILSSMNMLWALQVKEHQDTSQNNVMIERLERLCPHHPDKDIRTAFQLIKSTVQTNPPMSMIQIKNHLKIALELAKTSCNQVFMSIILTVMCNRFFSGVVGDQSIKSAQAALHQAGRSGNPLWKSVAAGLMANTLDVHGRKSDADAAMGQALEMAQKIFPSS